MLEQVHLRRRRRAMARELALKHRPPRQVWEGDYGDCHARLLAWAHGSAQFDRLMARTEQLPKGYGVGLDERVVELPWLYAQRPFGRLMDAGSTLNHELVLDQFQPESGWLCIATLRPEEAAYTQRGISYVYCDLRELPFRDGYFDSVVCASTLEHVGMDNTRYGDESPAAKDPAREQGAALADLLRVVAPGGRVLITVPYGRAEHHGWFRQYDEAALNQLLEGLTATVTVFAYGRDGWRLDTLAGAGAAEYNDSTDKAPSADGAVAARAVACIQVRKS